MTGPNNPNTNITFSYKAPARVRRGGSLWGGASPLNPFLKVGSCQTNNDWIWALALTAYAADQIQPLSGPIARTT